MRPLWYWRWRFLGKEPEVCLGCGGPLVQQAAARCVAASGAVELTLEGLPFRVCRDGCADRRLPRPGFVEELESALLDGGHVPTALATLQSDSLCCYACANRVWRAGPPVGEVHGTLPFAGLPSVGVRVLGPVRTCNGCGRLQLEPSAALRQALGQAVRSAIEGAGLRTTFR